MKRKALIALTVVVALLGGFLGYGWWTRRGPVEFARGGEFGATASPSPEASVSVLASPRVSRPASSASSAPAPRTQRTTVADGGEGMPAANDGLEAPRAGSYTFVGSGREEVKFGAASACSWEIDEVRMVAKRDGDTTVLDWVWSDNRQQRGIYRFGEHGMRQVFYGAAVTCVGVRRAEDGAYNPPMQRFPARPAPGFRWTSQGRAEDWTEHMRGEVLRRERVRVPAGTFDTLVVHMEVAFSEGQSGSFEATMWYAPALGIWVRERTRADVQASGADYASSYTIELARTPG